MRRPLLLVRSIAMLPSVFVLSLGGTALLAQQPADSTQEVVYEIGRGVTAPRPISTPNPEYSEKARKKKINGTVTVAMIVTPEGKVRDVQVIKSLNKELDKQVLAAVSVWKFEPATKDGKPVAVHLSAEVSFSLY